MAKILVRAALLFYPFRCFLKEGMAGREEWGNSLQRERKKTKQRMHISDQSFIDTHPLLSTYLLIYTTPR